MSKQRSPAERVSHAVRMKSLGVIGPSAMWLEIAEDLKSSVVTEVLDSLAANIKDSLLETYFWLPPHAYILRELQQPGELEWQTVYVQIVRWCEAQRPLDRPSSADGKVRVCIRDECVQEWLP